MKIENFFTIIFICVGFWQTHAVNSIIETCKDEKEFKNLLKTRPNLLILFSKNGKKKLKIFYLNQSNMYLDAVAKDKLKILKEVSIEVKNLATIAYINCEYILFFKLKFV